MRNMSDVSSSTKMDASRPLAVARAENHNDLATTTTTTSPDSILQQDHELATKRNSSDSNNSHHVEIMAAFASLLSSALHVDPQTGVFEQPLKDSAEKLPTLLVGAAAGAYNPERSFSPSDSSCSSHTTTATSTNYGCCCSVPSLQLRSSHNNHQQQHCAPTPPPQYLTPSYRSSSAKPLLEDAAANNLAYPMECQSPDELADIPMKLLWNLSRSFLYLVDSRLRSSLQALVRQAKTRDQQLSQHSHLLHHLHHHYYPGASSSSSSSAAADSAMSSSALINSVVDLLGASATTTTTAGKPGSAGGSNIAPTTIVTTFRTLAFSERTETGDYVIPLILECVMDLNVLGSLVAVRMEAPGTIQGTFVNSCSSSDDKGTFSSSLSPSWKLTNVKIVLDTAALLKSMMNQARIAVRRAIGLATDVASKILRLQQQQQLHQRDAMSSARLQHEERRHQQQKYDEEQEEPTDSQQQQQQRESQNSHAATLSFLQNLASGISRDTVSVNNHNNHNSSHIADLLRKGIQERREQQKQQEEEQQHQEQQQRRLEQQQQEEEQITLNESNASLVPDIPTADCRNSNSREQQTPQEQPQAVAENSLMPPPPKRAPSCNAFMFGRSNSNSNSFSNMRGLHIPAMQQQQQQQASPHNGFTLPEQANHSWGDATMPSTSTSCTMSSMRNGLSGSRSVAPSVIPSTRSLSSATTPSGLSLLTAAVNGLERDMEKDRNDKKRDMEDDTDSTDEYQAFKKRQRYSSSCSSSSNSSNNNFPSGGGSSSNGKSDSGAIRVSHDPESMYTAEV